MELMSFSLNSISRPYNLESPVSRKLSISMIRNFCIWI
ncbi:hypothetical protein LINPERHAP1_LOCUS34671 [Linum perenne]